MEQSCTMSVPIEKNEVVVSGMGVVCSVARDVPEFRKSLREGKDGISKLQAFSTQGMRSSYAGEIKSDFDLESLGIRDKKPVDRASVFTLKAMREAIADSRLSITEEESSRVGISMGTCGGGYLSGFKYLTKVKQRDRGPGNLLLDLPHHTPASRIAQQLQVHGGINIISNACASGGIAIANGIEYIRSGNAVIMIAGGYDTLSPLSYDGFGIMRVSSPSNRIRPFDKNRDGLLLGEGAAVLILESMEHCKRRGGMALARILGYGITSDTYHITSPDPSGRGASKAIDAALADARVNVEDVDYINAHGTGTTYNDRMECMAIKKVFGERTRSIPISSTKSMIGHTIGASGAIEAVASVIAMIEGFCPPTINYEDFDPGCDIDCVPNEAREARIHRVVSNSFGFGGTNCSIVIGKP